MDENRLIEVITEEVVRRLRDRGIDTDVTGEELLAHTSVSAESGRGQRLFRQQGPEARANMVRREAGEDSQQAMLDIASREYKDTIQFVDPENPLALNAMRKETTARIGIGRAGDRLTTKAFLSLRADHAMAKDAVMKEVDQKVLDDLHLDTVVSQCTDINVHLTRPDLGRKLSDEAVRYIQKNCRKNPQVQIYVSDGLSNSAVEENIREILPILTDGLEDAGITLGTPFFVKYGRVPTGDAVAELVGAEAVCVLLGERPGLNAADSMSAYITYGAKVGISESKRTVVSNIHRNGLQPVEAGAYLVEVIQKILENKKSGVDLKL